MADLWASLPVWGQNGAIGLALLCVPALIAAVLFRGYAPAPLIWATLRRHPGLNGAFVLLIAVSVALGVALIAQERGLRQGTAQAATGFDILVAAPGSELTAMLAAVFLQPADMGLVDGATFQALADHPRVTLAAPLAFGDSVDGAVIVGTTAAFVAHLTGGAVPQPVFTDAFDAVAGIDAPVAPGDRFTPLHGFGDGAEDVHADTFQVTARLPRTGTPWDRAILVPIEAVWRTHGLSDGHAEPGRLGPPFVPDLFPGTPGIILRTDTLASAYALRSDYTRAGETMAFFPGEVLSRLYVVMGDVRQAMSLLSSVTQLLVACAVLLALTILARLSVRRTAMLMALGAPRRFLVAVTWGHGAALLVLGTVLGLALGAAVAVVLSGAVAARTGIAVEAGLGWPELHLSCAFLALATLAALVPALLTARIDAAANLRG